MEGAAVEEARGGVAVEAWRRWRRRVEAAEEGDVGAGRAVDVVEGRGGGRRRGRAAWRSAAAPSTAWRGAVEGVRGGGRRWHAGRPEQRVWGEDRRFG